MLKIQIALERCWWMVCCVRLLVLRTNQANSFRMRHDTDYWHVKNSSNCCVSVNSSPFLRITPQPQSKRMKQSIEKGRHEIEFLRSITKTVCLTRSGDEICFSENLNCARRHAQTFYIKYLQSRRIHNDWRLPALRAVKIEYFDSDL